MKVRRLLSILILCLILSGCLMPVKLPVINTYLLNGEGIVAFKIPRYPHLGSILITQPIAEPGYQTSKIIYTTAPFELKAYSKQIWAAPPAQMLQSILANALEKCGNFHAVVTAPYIGVTRYRLVTRLIILRHEIFQQQSSQVRLALQATVINNANNQVMASKIFQIVEPAQVNPYSGVLAANRAAANLSKQVAYFVICAIRKIRY